MTGEARGLKPATIRDVADFAGRVSSSLFLGNRTRLVLEGIGTEPIVVESALRGSFEVGAVVPFRVKREGLMTLPQGHAAEVEKGHA